MKKKLTIEELQQIVSDYVEARDWRKFQHPKDLSMSVAIEAAELMELFQWKNQRELGNPKEIEKDFSEIRQNKKDLQRIKEELADVLIYCLELANILELDIGEIVKMKLKLSAKKYPEKK